MLRPRIGRNVLSPIRARPQSAALSAVGPGWTLPEIDRVPRAINTTRIPVRLPLDHGGAFPEITVRWEQWGDWTLPGDRTVFVMPSFSHGSHAASHAADPSPGWWEGFVGPGKHIDTNHFRVISAAILGSPFGTTSPVTPVPDAGIAPADLPLHTVGGAAAPPALLASAAVSTPQGETRTCFGPRFPVITPADQARAHALLLDAIGIDRLHAVVGGSLGGMQALQFAALFPDRVSRVAALSTTGRTTPFTVAVRRAQRQAIVGDGGYAGGLYPPGRAPVEGLRRARELGMMFYRSREELDARFDWAASGSLSASDAAFDVERYLSYQGAKFAPRFDANCYLALSRCMDLMDLSDDTGSFVAGVQRIAASTLLLPVTQDALTPPRELRAVHAALAAAEAEAGVAGSPAAGQSSLPRSTYEELDSPFGHDAMFHPECYPWFGERVKRHLEAGLQTELERERVHTTGLSLP